MYYKIFFPNYSVNYLKKQTLIIECDFFLHICKANVLKKKKQNYNPVREDGQVGTVLLFH